MLMKKPALFISLVAVCMSMLLSIGTAAAESISRTTTSVLHFQERLAEKGNVQAQYKLGSMYEFGIGTEKDLDAASEWYKQAASNGSVDAENRLTYLELRKNGFDKKVHTAWLNKVKKGVEAGDQNSSMLLGQMYSYGIGVNKDLDEAIRLLNGAGVYENPVVVYEIERVEKERKQLASQDRRQQEAEQKQREAEQKQREAEQRQREAEQKQQQAKLKQQQAKQEQKEEAKKTSQPEPEAVSGADVNKETDEMTEKRRRYEEVMRKLKEEERILQEQQQWAEGKRAKP